MLIKQFARFLKYEYSKGSPYFYHINDALKYYYEKYDKQEINRNRILLSQFSTNQNYSRMSLYSDCDFELAMILWDKHSGTKVHRHESECNFLLLEGNLFETKYKKTMKFDKYIELRPSDISNVKKDHFHKVNNINAGKSLTLHIYDNSNNYKTNFDLLMG